VGKEKRVGNSGHNVQTTNFVDCKQQLILWRVIVPDDYLNFLVFNARVANKIGFKSSPVREEIFVTKENLMLPATATNRQCRGKKLIYRLLQRYRRYAAFLNVIRD